MPAPLDKIVKFTDIEQLIWRYPAIELKPYVKAFDNTYAAKVVNSLEGKTLHLDKTLLPNLSGYALLLHLFETNQLDTVTVDPNCCLTGDTLQDIPYRSSQEHPWLANVLSRFTLSHPPARPFNLLDKEEVLNHQQLQCIPHLAQQFTVQRDNVLTDAFKNALPEFKKHVFSDAYNAPSFNLVVSDIIRKVGTPVDWQELNKTLVKFYHTRKHKLTEIGLGSEHDADFTARLAQFVHWPLDSELLVYEYCRKSELLDSTNLEYNLTDYSILESVLQLTARFNPTGLAMILEYDYTGIDIKKRTQIVAALLQIEGNPITVKTLIDHHFADLPQILSRYSSYGKFWSLATADKRQFERIKNEFDALGLAADVRHFFYEEQWRRELKQLGYTGLQESLPPTVPEIAL